MNLIDIVYASEGAEAVAEHGATAAGEVAKAGLLGSLGISLPLFIAQAVNFAIVAVILWFLILKPLTQKMTERQKLIDEGLDKAKKAGENLERADSQCQELFKRARNEAEGILNKAEEQAKSLKLEAAGLAKKQAEQVLLAAREQIEEEHKKILQEVKIQVAEVATAIAQKVLMEKITDKKDLEMIKEQTAKIKF